MGGGGDPEPGTYIFHVHTYTAKWIWTKVNNPPRSYMDNIRIIHGSLWMIYGYIVYLISISPRSSWIPVVRPPDIHGSKAPFPENGRCPNPSRRRQGMVTNWRHFPRGHKGEQGRTMEKDGKWWNIHWIHYTEICLSFLKFPWSLKLHVPSREINMLKHSWDGQLWFRVKTGGWRRIDALMLDPSCWKQTGTYHTECGQEMHHRKWGKHMWFCPQNDGKNMGSLILTLNIRRLSFKSTQSFADVDLIHKKIGRDGLVLRIWRGP